MGKRRPSLTDSQMAFSFDPPPVARNEGDLAGFDRVVASAVSRILKEDLRSRDEIAGRMSALMGEDVSRWMLDAYSSEARGDHNISAARLFVLIAATERFDVLHALVNRIGASILVGEELHTARVGHLMAQKAKIESELRALRPISNPIDRGSRG